MIITAFMLGLMGSLHCMMMCGPIVFGASQASGRVGIGQVLHGIQYNLGRTVSYVLLGLVFSLLGTVLALVGLQQILSVLSGVILLILFLSSTNIEKLITQNTVTSGWYQHYTVRITAMMTKFRSMPPIYVGFLNGLLPCGMVYIALVGALAAPSIWLGMSFMLFFGLGTIPLMLGLMLGSKALLKGRRIPLHKILSYGQLVVGIYLIARGVGADLPSELIHAITER